MIDYNVSGVSFLNVNTDSQQLKHSKAEETLQLGPNCTQGLGAGADPDVGKASAEEVVNEIQEYLDDANMVFLLQEWVEELEQVLRQSLQELQEIWEF